MNVNLQPSSADYEASRCPDNLHGNGLPVVGIGKGGNAEGDCLQGIENIIGSNYNDDLKGSYNGPNLLRGGGGADKLDGGESRHADDAVDYRDSPCGVSITLALTCGHKGSRRNAPDCYNIPRVGTKTSYAQGDTIYRIRTVHGSNHHDVINGSNDNDTLYGHTGNDRLYGAYGGYNLDQNPAPEHRLAGDRLYGGPDIDTADYSAWTGGALRITLPPNDRYRSVAGQHSYEIFSDPNAPGTVQAASDGGGWGTMARLWSIENAVGTKFDDILIGNALDNKLEGGAGNDTLRGGGQGDHLDGGSGGDTADYSTSDEAVSVSLAVGAASDGDLLFNIENVTGSAHDDTLTGDRRNNVLKGGPGDDTLDGGPGTDFAYYDGPVTVTDNADGTLTVTSEGNEGTDTLTNIEFVMILAVDGKTLTLTFHKDLDENRVPLPGHFKVTVDGDQRDVASGGVVVAGRAVTLTLEFAVQEGGGVRLSYTSRNRLRYSGGNYVPEFYGVMVANNTQ